jgi:hypothetical protein
MPTPRSSFGIAVYQNQIYCIGGYTVGFTATAVNEVYDPANDEWLTKASIPTAVSSYASAVVDNKIYVITSNLNQIYDAENDSWSLGAPHPCLRS